MPQHPPSARLGLTAKTLLMTSLVALAIAAAFAFMGLRFAHLRDSVQGLTSSQIEQLMTAVKLVQRSDTLALSASLLSQASTHDERRKNLMELRSHLAWIKRKSEDLPLADLDPQSLAHLQQLQRQLEANIEQLDAQVRARIDGESDAESRTQIRQLTQAHLDLAHELNVLLGYLATTSRKQIVEVSSELTAQVAQQQRHLLGLAALLLVAVLLSGLYVQRALVARIQRLQTALSQEPVQPQQLKQAGDDELSRLSHRVWQYVQRVQRHEVQMRRSNQELAYLAEHDALTQLANRRHFEAALQQRLRLGELPLCIAIADIDFFKTVNDLHGHAQGDAVLVHVARCLQQHLRAQDVLARLGGEEFGLVLPVHHQREALEILERIRVQVEQQPYRSEAGNELKLSISLGCVLLQGRALGLDAPLEVVEALRFAALEAADRALYSAKRDGRNRVKAAAQVLYTQAFTSGEQT